jgi:hypothetical protein
VVALSALSGAPVDERNKSCYDKYQQVVNDWNSQNFVELFPPQVDIVLCYWW